ncbi:MAG TPA: hypothetical protein G4N94_11505 [Caldilineae bacterium]|nr:hypothetical protein [Caldilineae bacterium]
MKRLLHSTTTLLLAVLLMILLALILNQPTSALPTATTRYVAPGGHCGAAASCYANVQAAVDAADPGDEIKVAQGAYAGVSARAGVTQTVYISKTVTIRGGYTTANWTTPDPVAHPTILDATGKGRVLYLVGPATVTISGLQIRSP